MHCSLGFMVNNYPTLRIGPEDEGGLVNQKYTYYTVNKVCY